MSHISNVQNVANVISVFKMSKCFQRPRCFEMLPRVILTAFACRSLHCLLSSVSPFTTGLLANVMVIVRALSSMITVSGLLVVKMSKCSQRLKCFTILPSFTVFCLKEPSWLVKFSFTIPHCTGLVANVVVIVGALSSMITNIKMFSASQIFTILRVVSTDFGILEEAFFAYCKCDGD